MTELTTKVLDALNEALGANSEPCHRDLQPIAKKLGCTLHCGATRFAFVFKNHRIVYKFPRYEETCRDYCELEVRNYELGKQYRIEKILLPIEKVGALDNGLPVYTQSAYTCSHQEKGYSYHEFLQEKIGGLHKAPIMRKIMHGCLESPSRLWLERATQIYGKRFMLAFQRWSHEAEVNDLHDSNVGWCGRLPVIIDYAGYCGD